METIKQIRNFSDYYVSDTGRVFSNKKGNLIMLLPRKTNSGYFQVGLWKDGKCYNRYIHRLVAEAFIPNNDNKRDVNHIDGNKLNNFVYNLEWLSHSDNVIHSYVVLKRKPTWINKTGALNPSSKAVIQIKDNKIVAEFVGISEAERKTGISHQHISHCCKGKRNYAGGFNWKYKV